METVQAKDDGSLDQSISNRDDEKQLDSRFKLFLMGLANGLDVGCERWQGLKDDY